VGSQGRLIGLLEGMECPSSKALNRLAGVEKQTPAVELKISMPLREAISGD